MSFRKDALHVKKTTVITYLLTRLHDLGITDIFGIPGDYSLPICDAIVADTRMRYVGTCNELNAAYAADGYARVKRFGAITTAFGVGELSAINGICGAFAENVPIFHIAGAPATNVQQKGSIVHHTLGNGEFDRFHDMAKLSCVASSSLTVENAIFEIERLIEAATFFCRPVYMSIAKDVVDAEILIPKKVPSKISQSNPQALCCCVEAICERFKQAKSAVILPGIITRRFNLSEEAQRFIEATGCPYATMMSDKAILDETHPQYIGMYNGALMNDEVREYVEGADLLCGVAAQFSDFNTGAFTAKIDRERLINILPHEVHVGTAIYKEVLIWDVLKELIRKVEKRKVADAPKPKELGVPKRRLTDPITSSYLFPRYEAFLRPDDIVVAETGSQHMGLAFGLMKKGVQFLNQTLWCSIGWATCAALGACIAAHKSGKRVIMITGEGSHQFTLQELATFGRYGFKPIIICVNNDGYTIERYLSHDPMAEYNDIARMNYHLLPEALGCKDWMSVRVATCGELDMALKNAELAKSGVYIEVMMDKMDAPLFVQRLRERASSFHSAS